MKISAKILASLITSKIALKWLSNERWYFTRINLFHIFKFHMTKAYDFLSFYYHIYFYKLSKI